MNVMPRWILAIPSLYPKYPRWRDCKPQITMRVDNDTLAIFKARAEMSGGNYQTLMNEALRKFAQGITLADVMQETIRKELHQV